MKNKTPIFLASIILSLTACSPSFDVPREEFYFSLSWGYALDDLGSYDSRTNVLIKTTKVRERKPEDYITTYEFPKMDEIYNDAKSINIYSYPDTYNPYAKSNLYCIPSMNYILEINDKTITTLDCCGSREFPKGMSKKDKNYIEFIFKIMDIVRTSDEWKALPDYEYYYL